MYARDFYKNGHNRGDCIVGEQKIREAPCLMPFTTINYIDNWGKVLPCCDFRSDIAEHLVIGDLNKVSLVDAIFNKKSCEFRKSLFNFDMKEGACKFCTSNIPSDIQLIEINKIIGKNKKIRE